MVWEVAATGEYIFKVLDYVIFFIEKKKNQHAQYAYRLYPYLWLRREKKLKKRGASTTYLTLAHAQYAYRLYSYRLSKRKMQSAETQEKMYLFISITVGKLIAIQVWNKNKSTCLKKHKKDIYIRVVH